MKFGTQILPLLDLLFPFSCLFFLYLFLPFIYCFLLLAPFFPYLYQFFFIFFLSFIFLSVLFRYFFLSYFCSFFFFMWAALSGPPLFRPSKIYISHLTLILTILLDGATSIRRRLIQTTSCFASFRSHCCVFSVWLLC